MHPYKLDPVIDLETKKTVYRYEFDYCPVNYVQHEHKALVSVFLMWKQGHKYFDGGIGAQPAKYIDAMLFLDGIWAAHERKLLDDARKGKS